MQDYGATRFDIWWEPVSSLKTIFSLWPHMAEGAKELLGDCFIRALIPFMRDPPLWLNHLPKAPTPNTIILGVKMSTHKLRGGTQIFRPLHPISTGWGYSYSRRRNCKFTWQKLGTELPSWGVIFSRHRVPCLEGSMVGLMLCCCYLEILNHFLTRSCTFSICPRSWKWCSWS